MPRQPIHVIIEPIRHFMHIESASGVVLLAATAVALAAANSPLGEAFLGFWQQPFGFRLGGFHLEFSVQQRIMLLSLAIADDIRRGFHTDRAEPHHPLAVTG